MSDPRMQPPSNTTTQQNALASARLINFLGNYRVERGCEFTHTSLGRPAGSYYIPVDVLNTFYTLYMDAMDAGADLHITEKHRHIAPILIDLDMRFVPTPQDLEPLPSIPKRRYTQADVDAIVRLYIEGIQSLVDTPSRGSQYEVLVLEKKAPSLANELVKDGLHIMVPALVTKPSIQYMLRNYVLERLPQVWGHLGLQNAFADVVDEAVIERNNWFMYGSKKPATGAETYRVTRTLTVDATSGCIQENDTPMVDSENEYVERLSIRNKYVETPIKIDRSQDLEAFEKELELQRRRMNLAKNIVTTDRNNAQNTYDNIEVIHKLIDILNVEKRSNDYHNWIRLGWCLRNIDHRLLDAWDKISRNSNKYVEGECARLWNHMRTGGLNIGTLHMWAKEDNPEAYKEIIRTDLRMLVEKSYFSLPTHHDVAKVVHAMYKHEFVCSSIKNRTWYHFKNHRWHVSDSGYALRMRISTEVAKEYSNEAFNWQRKASIAATEKDLKEGQDMAKRCNEICFKLRQTSYKDNIMKECAELFYQEKFEEKLDSNTSLIGFNNGVFDIDIMEFREGHPEDYISFTTGNNYVDYDPTHPHMQAIFTYLDQVLPKQHVRDYVMKLFASMLNGAIKEQKFYIWTGSGSNSKSKLVELFEKSFGDYCIKFPITILTMKRAASNAANPELARAKGKRFACLQEPSEDEKIEIGAMKEYSGGDRIMARPLYSNPFEYVPQFKMLLLCNHLPRIPSDDGGTWRRIRVVEFTSKFVDDPQGENEFPIDMELSKKLEDWREHFMALLIHYYKRYVSEGMKEPEEVTVCTRDYKRQNDHLADFIHNCTEPHPGSFLTLSDAFAELKAWLKDDNIPMKTPTKPELEKYLTKNLIKTTTMAGSKGYRGFKIRNRYAGGGGGGAGLGADEGDGID